MYFIKQTLKIDNEIEMWKFKCLSINTSFTSKLLTLNNFLLQKLYIVFLKWDFICDKKNNNWSVVVKNIYRNLIEIKMKINKKIQIYFPYLPFISCYNTYLPYSCYNTLVFLLSISNQHPLNLGKKCFTHVTLFFIFSELNLCYWTELNELMLHLNTDVC